jgi:DNA primase
MDADSIMTLLERLGCRRIRKRGDEVNCSCPFSENHKHGDRNPSFGAQVNSDGTSPYNCFACGARGAMEGLAIKSGNNDLVPDYKPRKPARTSWYFKKKRDRFDIPANNERPVLFKDERLMPFHGVLSEYLIQRGITVETARTWELGKDSRFKRAIFPTRDYQGRLAVITGRDVTDKSRMKYSHYVLDTKSDIMMPYIPKERDENEFVRPTKKFFLYGEHIYWPRRFEAEYQKQDLVVVEGPMDVLSMYQKGYNAVAIQGSYPSDYQVNKLVELTPRFGRLIVMADSDKAGENLTVGIIREIRNRVPVYDASLKTGYDPDSADKDDIEFALQNAVIRKRA